MSPPRATFFAWPKSAFLRGPSPPSRGALKPGRYSELDVMPPPHT